MVRGVVYSVLASSLFGLMYYYTSLLHPLSSEQIFGWRMLLTVPIMGLMIVLLGETRQLQDLLHRLRREPVLWLTLPTSSALLGLQLWLFMWAPSHGKALEVSLGYFMLPLALIAMGKLVYGERLSSFQKLAAACAAIGVVHELLRVGGFSWASLAVCMGYPFYFYLRRRMKTDQLAGLWSDMLLTLPLAFYFVFWGESGQHLKVQFELRPMLFVLVIGLGVISSAALVSYILASRRVPFSLFGLLGYVEPVLLVFVSLLLGERIGASEWLTYIPIWLAVGVLMLEGLVSVRRPVAPPLV
ncbi:EamA family transporter RarD [Limnobacter humi]|uniref:EamA family transporter RarD n=1 Tax=Limnobacter humi TaxID=1778671 RepID=A0ABT1WGF5_9BURK|nr:EamA family transporter RarD [Limnobacter humi]MCQ8896607.1 EamA family transporter RarD [Limnobacter humi]